MYSILLYCLSYICPCIYPRVMRTYDYSNVIRPINKKIYNPVFQNNRDMQSHDAYTNIQIVTNNTQDNEGNEDNIYTYSHLSDILIPNDEHENDIKCQHHTSHEYSAQCEFCGRVIHESQFCCKFCAQVRFSECQKYKKI